MPKVAMRALQNFSDVEGASGGNRRGLVQAGTTFWSDSDERADFLARKNMAVRIPVTPRAPEEPKPVATEAPKAEPVPSPATTLMGPSITKPDGPAQTKEDKPSNELEADTEGKDSKTTVEKK